MTRPLAARPHAPLGSLGRSLWLVGWVALAGGGPAVAGETERLTGPVPEVVQSFEETLARYRARVAEIEAGALAALQQQKADQVAELTRSYDARLAQLDDRLLERRKLAVDKFEEFLTRYQDLAWGSDVRLRLAELLFQDAQERWRVESNTYDAAIEAAGDDLDKLAMVEDMGEPSIELGRVVQLLQEIIASNRDLPRDQQYELLDVAYYMLAFCYSDENSDRYDRPLARATFRELVQARADSEYADAAHLILGNYAFEDNDLASAIAEFQQVIANGPERKHYSAATYQLAWARYKRSEYQEATSLFVQLLDQSEEGVKRGRRPSDYANDAITYLALSLSDEADQLGTTPVKRATSFFRGLGGARPYEWDVLKALGDALVRYDRSEDAVEVYQAMVDRPEFALRPENPDLQAEVVRLLSRGYYADLKAAGEARLQMAERFGEGTEWWNANRVNPEAQAKARKYIESLLLEVAKEVKVRAAESGDPATYSLAADKYREYLDKFPISDNYFANEFQLADALYQARRLDEAAKEYLELLKNERFHPYGDISTYQLFRTWQQVVLDRVGPTDKTYPSAEVERVYTSVGGVEIPVYHLEDAQREFVVAIDAVLARRFGEPVEGMEVRPLVEANRVKLMYLAAQVLFYANRFDDARPRLQAIIDRYPRTDEAAWAANLLLTTYINEKDSEQIRRWSRTLYTMRLGATASEVESRAAQFRDTLEKATFEIGLTAARAGDFEAAATAYLAFVDEFKGSQNVPTALLNAASSYEQIGRTADANAIYERFIHEFPDHPESMQLFYNIASNYEATLELDRALALYQEMVDRFPNFERSADALYMIAFLKEGTGDKLGAAQGYEAYGKRYPEASDRESVVFRAGRVYEGVDAERAIRFYRSYLSQFGTASPDHAIAAQYRIAKLLQQQGKARDASQALDEVVALYDRVVDAGTTIGPEARDQAAEAAFRSLQARHDKLVATQLSKNEAKNAELLLTQLPDELKQFAADIDAFSVRYLSFEYTTGAFYLLGSAQAQYAKLGLSIEPPPEMVDEARDAYWQLLEQEFFPLFYQVEEQAVATLDGVVKLGRDQGRYSVWIDRAYELLNQIKPEVYPAAKRTLPGGDDVVGSPTLAPMLPEERGAGGGP
ncbi:MAG TPA: tetratricopeptide repeat protein [Myxococcota bacterium]|nr:tetratricopeptide repeat protein [Myxococcota bacterium]